MGRHIQRHIYRLWDKISGNVFNYFFQVCQVFYDIAQIFIPAFNSVGVCSLGSGISISKRPLTFADKYAEDPTELDLTGVSYSICISYILEYSKFQSYFGIKWPKFKQISLKCQDKTAVNS